MYKNKKIGITGSIITIIILLILVFTTNANVNSFSKIENVIGKVIMPIQNGITHLKNKIEKNETNISNIEMLQEEINNLRKQNEELTLKLEEVEMMRAENGVLRELVSLSEKYAEYKTIGAYIINKNVNNIDQTFIINVGNRDGVKVNQTVIAENGLVGHIISVTKNTAKVEPIIDVTSNVSGEMESSMKNVIARGRISSNKTLRVDFVQADTEFVIDDVIKTSGLGGIYPKGITIGRIKEIIETKNVTEKYAILETAVDFENLKYVLVIKE